MISTYTARALGALFLIGSAIAASHVKVIGGDKAKIKEFPYIVSIRISGEHFCGGTIISDKHILTAAHCVHFLTVGRIPMNLVTVHSGTSRTDKNGTVHTLKASHSHPGFNFIIKDYDIDDVAVITLEEPIVFNKYQQKINLASRDVQPYEVGYALGWGMTANSDSNSSSKELLKLKVALLSGDKCNPLLDHKIDKKSVCIFRSDEQGICNGDSGGPLVSHGEVVGVTSFKDKLLCASGTPDVFMNVFSYKDFIESAMNE